MFVINTVKNKNNIYILKDTMRFLTDKQFYKMEIYQKNELIISLKIPKNELNSKEIKKKNFEDFFVGYKK